MTYRPVSNRPVRVWLSPLRYTGLMTPGGWLRLGLLVLVIVVLSHIYGRYLASRSLAERDATIQQLQTEGEKVAAQMADQGGKNAELQAKLTKVQNALNALMPSDNTYSIIPNQSLIVADGHLTVGLVGSPRNEGITININGKPQSATAGDVIHVTADQSTTCEIGVQSFDMFKALITASCAAKSQ